MQPQKLGRAIVGGAAIMGLFVAVASLAWRSRVLLLSYPAPWPDEPLFAAPAIALLRGHGLGTDLLGDLLPGIGTHTYWVPPLQSLCLAAAFKLSGISLVAQRATSWIAAWAALALTYVVARKAGLSRPLGALAVALVAQDVVFLRGALVGRMDMIALALLLAATAAHLAARPFATGLLAGLAVLTHPFAIVPMGVLVAFSPRRLQLAWGVALPVLFAVLYASLDPHAFIGQVGAQLGRKASHPASLTWDVAMNLAQYGPGRGIGDVLLRALTALAVALGALGLWRLCRPAFAVQIAILFCIIVGRELWYPLYAVPLTAVGVSALVGDRARWLAVGGLVLFVAVWACNLARTNRLSGGGDYPFLCGEIAAVLPRNATVVVAAIPDPAPGLALRPDLHLLEFPPEGLRIDAARRARHLARADYAIVSPECPSSEVETRVRESGTLVRDLGPLRVYRLPRS